MTVRSIAILGILSVTACLSHHHPNLAPLPAGTVLCAKSAQIDDRAPFVSDLRLRNKDRAPDLSDFIAVEHAGGHVVHAFEVPVIRVRIDGSGLRQLLTDSIPLADAAYVVSDSLAPITASAAANAAPTCAP